jgi:glycosyltransferase involved in cell wall biosynthesis
VTQPARLRIVHVVVAGEIGGAERMLADLAARPDQSGADHVVALMTPNDALAAFFRDAGLDVRDRGRVREDAAAFLWRTLGPRDVAWLAELLAEERAHAVHLHTFGSQVVGARAALRRGIPVVRTEHSTRVYTDASCWPFARWSLRRATAIAAISAHVRDVALSRAPWIAPRLDVIPNGVDTSIFAPPARPPPPGPFRFALVGRLEPRKGIDLALDALALVPDVRLDVVGDGDQRARLEARAAPLGQRVTFHGRLDDVRPVVGACDAALCSSREEGLGIALLEAMAMAKPVVGFPVGGVPEFVTNGETGLLARAHTAAALAERMRDALAERAGLPALGRAARARVEAGFSIDAMRSAYGALYARAVRSNSDRL